MFEAWQTLAELATVAHGVCLAGFNGALVAGLASGGIGVALAYVVGIPFMILPWVIVSRRPGEYAPFILGLIGVGFIVACGGTHVIDVVTIWAGSPETYMLKIAILWATVVVSWAFPIGVFIAGRLGWRIQVVRRL
jgi:hypothetical protein